MSDAIAGKKARAAKRPSREQLKLKLILAAERVVAQRGFTGATVKEIHSAANARNTSAIHYHFGSVEAVLAAVFEYRSAPLVISNAATNPGVEDVVSALVTALTAFLHPKPEGNYYLRFLERALVEQRLARTFVPPSILDVWDSAEDIMRRALSSNLPPKLVDVRITFARSHLVSALAQVEVWISSDNSSAIYLPALTRVVIDSTVSMLTAPISDALATEMSRFEDHDGLLPSRSESLSSQK